MQKEFPNRDIGNLFMDTHFGSTSDNPDNPLSLRPLSLSPSHARFVSPDKIDTSRYWIQDRKSQQAGRGAADKMKSETVFDN